MGAPLEIAGIAVRRPQRARNLPVDPGLFTADAAGLVTRDDIDIVIEVVGGIEPARSWMLAAMAGGKSVVTANKALLADDGTTPVRGRRRRRGRPLLRGERRRCHSAAAAASREPRRRPVVRVLGIVNGTTNYILTRMDETGASFSEALEEATALGYAEADPTADIDGFDAASKAAILASLAFHTRVRAADVYREGIGAVTISDMASAKAMGATVKLLAIAERAPTESGHQRAGAPGDDPADPSARRRPRGLQRGLRRGRGRRIDDVLRPRRRRRSHRIGRARRSGHRRPQPARPAAAARASRRTPISPALPMGRTITRYHVSLDVADKAGVLAVVANAFASQDVSISSVRQEGRGDDASLVLVTHSASDAALAATVDELRDLDVVRAVASVMRVEGET